ncbi:MAG: hypothetical protein IPJ27_06345 [Candidatus Accumulibacter sp.]|uniref:Uncharacterized protein n=1 Tax=Candidatus Accumulibacter proximus TaxID=2954385 RepID=A0A935UG73_9PROT|nr:hypothetical protein [Candidatus Accumulibacter proximus]
MRIRAKPQHLADHLVLARGREELQVVDDPLEDRVAEAILAIQVKAAHDLGPHRLDVALASAR